MGSGFAPWRDAAAPPMRWSSREPSRSCRWPGVTVSRVFPRRGRLVSGMAGPVPTTSRSGHHGVGWSACGGFVAVAAAGVAVEDAQDLGGSAGGADGMREHRGELGSLVGLDARRRFPIRWWGLETDTARRHEPDRPWRGRHVGPALPARAGRARPGLRRLHRRPSAADLGGVHRPAPATGPPAAGDRAVLPGCTPLSGCGAGGSG